MSKTKSVRGFTLLEILLVVGIIAILAGIVILAINPSKQLGDSRNAERRSDVLTILNAIYQYAIDNNGVLIEINNGSALPISDDCEENGVDAMNLEDYIVTASSTYLTDIPTDPLASGGDSAYYVVQNDANRITVCALETENNIPIIEVTR